MRPRGRADPLCSTPPFDDGPLDPGYIKGYLPGIRENGAQYTHAAVWVVQAAASARSKAGPSSCSSLLNPIDHAEDPEGGRSLQGRAVCRGRRRLQPASTRRPGGWTWYTGSAAWLYRVGLESILGFRTIRQSSCTSIPASRRSGLALNSPTGTGPAHLPDRCRESKDVASEGSPTSLARRTACDRREISLVDDGQSHEVRVVMGNS